MCDCLVALGSGTRSGVTLFAKNSDRPESECQVFLQFPASVWSPGSRLGCSHIEIPQVERTHAVMGHSPWWVWGFEQGVNEHGVAIGNETVFSKEPIEEAPGLIGMDLVRLGLERAATSREALGVITDLIAAHGQGGSAFAPGAAGYHNGFVLADAEEAWLLQTSNRRWAARRTTRDALSNHLSIGADWEQSSPDLADFARREGWWKREDRVDLAAAYRNPGVPGRISEGRLRRSRGLLEDAGRALDVAGMQAALRDHLDGGGVRLGGTAPEDEAYYTLCMHSEPVGTTTASLVAALAPAADSPRASWISFATPCTGVFLPVYVDAALPAELGRGDADPSDDSAWWAFKRLQDAAARDFERHTPRLREAWKPFETQVEKERVCVEADATTARAKGDTDASRELLTEFALRTWTHALARARELSAQLGAD